ncbi:MAG: ParA family protein [Deltaproteobacteria bacterium]|nr:ParA family protein [Deltaproteobacteria bacterium]MBW2019659.1 ParA family protein [Deltaproteobacteria bacterium]MBW2074153.1 ParA family protein [Deltaproteobacteria bacterium]RLB83652.1 MAG: ParA family protein [Deltaproteobacteria bacterium]
MATRKARIIAVVNEKGGVGKTVTVINLGAGLSLEGKDVLVVDMDPQFNATRGLGVSLGQDSPSVYDVIKLPEPVPARSAIVKTAWEHLDLLPSHVDLSGVEVELVNEPGRENRLKEALTPVLDLYDFIVVDTPPSLSILTVNVLAFASEILVPCQTQPYAYSALDELLETISIIKEEMNPDIRILGVLATFFDQRTRVSNKILESLRRDGRFQDKLFKTVIRINTTVAESAYYGKPVVFFRPSSTGAADYLALTEEILS